MDSLQQVAKAIGVLLLATLCVVALGTVFVVALDFILLIFLGVLFSVFLTRTSQFVNRYLSLGYSWSLALVITLLMLIVVGGFVLLGNKVHDQLQATSQRLDEGMSAFSRLLERHPLVLTSFKRIPFAQELILDHPSSDSSQTEYTGSRTSESNVSGPSESERKQVESPQAPAGSGSESSTDTEMPSSPESTAELMRSSAGRVFSILGGILSTSLGLVANVGLIFFVGIFIAVDPALYRDGFARLFPLERRERVSDILSRMSSALFNWLMGRFLAMLITGGGTAVALLVLGIPMAVSVGVITGLLTFVPNIGAIVGLVLAILMALPQGMATVGWVVGLYAVLQLLESNVITPLVQQHQTAIPPALLLSFQVIMGALAGFLGLMVATPLLAASLVLIEQAWIKDVLGEPSSET